MHALRVFATALWHNVNFLAKESRVWYNHVLTNVRPRPEMQGMSAVMNAAGRFILPFDAI